MRGWLGTDTALPMSWQREATTSSSSAPACSARVAVCRQWVSWSTANPSTTSDSDSNMARTRSATRLWFLTVSTPICAHWSPVETSMLMKEVVIPVFSHQIAAVGGSDLAGQALQDVGCPGGAIVGQYPGGGCLLYTSDA